MIHKRTLEKISLDKDISNKESVAAFSNIIRSTIPDGKKGRIPLINITFFAGAGFSKSWDSRFPIGIELFDIGARDIPELLEKTDYFLSSQGYSTGMHLEYSAFKDLVYNLTMQLKYPSLRTRYVDSNNIIMVLNELKAIIYKKFQETIPLNYFDSENGKFSIEDELTKNQKKILSFFSLLKNQQDGSLGIPIGIRVHFITTNYDFTIETILDTIIGEDDSVFLYTYRGFTPLYVHGFKNPVDIHEHFLVDNLIKINGGFEILQKADGYELNYLDRGFDKILENPPHIILPNREQDYTERYFSWVFPKAIRLLQESNLLVIVGYSIPEEDAMLRFLIKQFAEDLGDAANKFLFYVDKMELDKQIKRLRNVFPYLEQDTFNHSKIFLFQGDFADWAQSINDNFNSQGY